MPIINTQLAVASIFSLAVVSNYAAKIPNASLAVASIFSLAVASSYAAKFQML